MRDPAGPPTWLLIVVALGWMFTLGLWVERNRRGGTHELRADVAELQQQHDELLDTIDELVEQAERNRTEIRTRRLAATHTYPSTPVTPALIDQALRLVQGGRA